MNELISSNSTEQQLSPRMDLVQFFRHWYLPVVILPRELTDASVGKYVDALNWWQRLTGGQPVEEIDDAVIARFRQGLRTATYKRGDCGREQPLSGWTRRTHLKMIRSILLRLGANVNPRVRCAGLITNSLYFDIREEGRKRAKPVFSVADAQKIFAATAKIDWPGRGKASRPASPPRCSASARPRPRATAPTNSS
jgi:hypothetical protein